MTVGGVRTWLKGKEAQDKEAQGGGACGLKEMRDALKKKMFDDIASDLGRMNDAMDARGDLKEQLEELRGSLDGRFGEFTELTQQSTMTAAVEDLNELRQKLRAAELDEAQCRARMETVRHSLEALRSLELVSYERELARLEGEVEKILTLPVEERLFELEGVLEQLREMDRFAQAAAETDIGGLEERRYVYNPSRNAPQKAGSSSRESRLRMVREIRDWAGRIAQVDEIEGEKLLPALENLKADSPFPDRLASLRDQMKTAWGALRERAASTAFFRDKLEELLGVLQASQNAADSREGSELIRRCGAMRGGKFIDRALFMTLYEEICRFVWARNEEIADAFFAQKVEQALSEMGYELLSDELPDEAPQLELEGQAALQTGQIHYLESPYEGYRVMLKVDSKGTVTTRLVRVVESDDEANNKANDDKNASADQKQKDREAGGKWCHDFDGFLEKMREQNLPLDVTLRKEPDETELLTVVDKNPHGREERKKRGKKGRKQLSTERKTLDGAEN
jgi:hypothetical protein